VKKKFAMLVGLDDHELGGAHGFAWESSTPAAAGKVFGEQPMGREGR